MHIDNEIMSFVVALNRLQYKKYGPDFLGLFVAHDFILISNYSQIHYHMPNNGYNKSSDTTKQINWLIVCN